MRSSGIQEILWAESLIFLDRSVISRPHPFAFHMLFLRGAANQKNAGLLGYWINVDDRVIPLTPLKSS